MKTGLQFIAKAVLLLAVAAGFGPVLFIGLLDFQFTFDRYLWAVLRFTLVQAALSTLLSVLLGIAFGRALAHVSFPGHSLIVQLLTLPQALPAIVVVLGIISVFGGQGILGGLFDIYGLSGILLAHVFFNFPLASRLTYAAVQAIPADAMRLADQLGFSNWQTWRLIEWPAIRAVVPGLVALIFLLCTASFTIVLTLGGPQATTLEVAIYQSLRLDFDPARAAALSLLQVVVCASLVALVQKYPGKFQVLSQLQTRKRVMSGRSSIMDWGFVVLGLVLLAPPLLSILADGLAGLFLTPVPIGPVVTSLMIGACASVVSLSICWLLASPETSPTGQILVYAALILPPAVIATGWFIALNRFGPGTAGQALLVIALNALMALPYVYNVLRPAMQHNAANHDRICASLGIAGFNRFRRVDLPVMRRPLLLAAVVAMIVAMGDLTAVLLFGSGSIVTLPTHIYQLMGAYRLDQAASTALLLAMLAGALLWMAEALSDD